MTVLVGDASSRRIVAELQALGWGRMRVERRRTPWRGEPWALDNGAFKCWKLGLPWDAGRFLGMVDWALTQATPPLFGVLPDVVAAGAASLDHSLAWRARLPEAIRWYLPLQDGMREADVLPHIERLSGLFLGGTDAFKATAARWCRLAHAHGLRFHYARAGTACKVAAAFRVGADSLDSAFPLFHRERWRRFVRLVTAPEEQLRLPVAVAEEGRAAGRRRPVPVFAVPREEIGEGALPLEGLS
jgi:hypothetical protein